MKTKVTKIINLALGISLAFAVLAGLCGARSAFAGKVAPGHSSAFGKTLAAWEALYFRWAYGNVSIPTDANGNAVVAGRVVLMPIPAAPGDGTPGHLDVTLNSGQPFMLPLWGLLGTSYSDGTPPDPFLDVNVFQTLDLTFKIDGVTVVNSANVMEYYSQFSFTPAIPLDFAPINGIIWFQGIGVTHTPLTPGIHTMTLHAENTQPAFGSIFEYNNTWNITVNP